MYEKIHNSNHVSPVDIYEDQTYRTPAILKEISLKNIVPHPHKWIQSTAYAKREIYIGYIFHDIKNGKL